MRRFRSLPGSRACRCKIRAGCLCCRRRGASGRWHTTNKETRGKIVRENSNFAICLWVLVSLFLVGTGLAPIRPGERAYAQERDSLGAGWTQGPSLLFRFVIERCQPRASPPGDIIIVPESGGEWAGGGGVGRGGG